MLKKILDRLDYRLNPVVFIPLSAFLCWDLQQILSLEKWKAENRYNITAWFESLAHAEALCSLGALAFNHPEWSIPVLTDEEAVFSADNMGHPLIPKEKRVDNSFSTTGTNQLSLITGSNMAGKSTFLRSAGVNIVLAMAGAPVCAQRLTLSPMKVMSSMRVNDNLEESTSTFYAELKKLKEIIEAVYRNEKVFLLLDEILRGTNSADRHTGSAALLKQLIQHNATGMIATHDLELAKLAVEFPANIHNYHFDVQVTGDELFFDYKLKKGICRSMNASLLMKKIGIEL
jgi:DNA mismatch repair ATPase MutS